MQIGNEALAVKRLPTEMAPRDVLRIEEDRLTFDDQERLSL
jgi:hypothetical protein